MMLNEVTPVPDSALPVDAFKAHLRLGSGFGQEDVQDAVLVSFLRAAMAAIEARCGKAVLRRAFRWEVTRWRDGCAEPVPLAPVAAITGMLARDAAGVEVPVPQSAYWLEQDAQRPVLRATGAALPAVPPRGAVVLTLEAGFGGGWDDVPPDLRQAVLMLAAHYYEYREDRGRDGACMPFGVSSLIQRYRDLRIGFGAEAGR